MAEIIKSFDEFKDMLESKNIPYVELPQSTLIVKDGGLINIRQYHDSGYCLSSWVNKDEFKNKVKELEAI